LLYQPIIEQFQRFIVVLPDLVVKVINSIIERFPWIQESLNWDTILSNIQESFWQSSGLTDFITNIPKYIFSIIGSFITILISFFSVIILSIFFIQGKDISKEKLQNLFPIKHQERFTEFINNVENQMGAWLRGQILLMLVIGILSWLGFTIIGLEFSIPIGVVGGLLEAVPNVGPMITLVLALVVGVGSEAAVWKIIFIAVWFILIQQFENYVIVPKVMQKVVGANPILTIIGVLVGSRLFGIWGALLSVPLVAIIQIILRDYMKYRNSTEDIKSK
jgi:predicted PurR-regulated permease PerM